jgi:hypothetical protein
VIWVAVFGGIALVGLVMLISYGVWLAHKAADVMSEIEVLADRAGQLADLLSQIQPASDLDGSAGFHSDLMVAEELQEQPAT